MKAIAMTDDMPHAPRPASSILAVLGLTGMDVDCLFLPEDRVEDRGDQLAALTMAHLNRDRVCCPSRGSLEWALVVLIEVYAYAVRARPSETFVVSIRRSQNQDGMPWPASIAAQGETPQPEDPSHVVRLVLDRRDITTQRQPCSRSASDTSRGSWRPSRPTSCSCRSLKRL